MARINIRDASGAYEGWFDDGKSESWRDDDSGQTLYRQVGGGRSPAHRPPRWVLHLWSGGNVYRFIGPDEARAWLTSRELPLPDDDDEPSRGGRPEIGNPVRVRLGGLLPSVDAIAAQRGESRSDCIRHLIAVGLHAETQRQEPAT